MTAAALFEQRISLARWGAAAAIVVSAHAAIATGYMVLREAAGEGAPQAPVVILELAPMPAAPASEVDVAPGPLMQEARAAAEAKPAAPEKIEPLPPAQESVIATREARQVEAVPERRPPAPRTSAAPRSPVHTGSIAAAPAPGAAVNSVSPAWINLLFSHLLRYRQYPSAAQAARQEGIVTINFTVDRNGRVLSRRLLRSSGHALLDAEALAMIERAQPLPAFPPDMAGATRSFTAPIKFSLR